MFIIVTIQTFFWKAESSKIIMTFSPQPFRASLSFCGVALLALSAPSLYGQTAPRPFALTVDNIMRGPELIGYAPIGVRWSQDSRHVYFEWKQAGESRRKEYAHYVVSADGSGLHRLTDEDAKLLPPAFRELSPDKRLAVYTEGGDIFLYYFAQNQRRQLTSTVESENNPRFNLDGKSLVFERQNNLFEMSLTGGELKQLTDIRRGAAPDPALFAAQAGGRRRAGAGGRQNGAGTGAAQANAAQSGGTGAAGTERPLTSQDALKKTEAELFESIREDARQRDEQEAKRKQQEHGKRKPFTLAPGQNMGGLRLSPDGLWVSLMIREGGEGEKSAVIPHYVTESGYTEDQPGRGLVGDVQGTTRMVLLNVATGDAKPVTFMPPPLTAIGVRAGTRRVNWQGLLWSEDGKRAVATARTSDNKDAWLLNINPATGATTVLAQIHDEAWVGRFGGGNTGFLPDNRHVYFVSERDGFAHLYVVATDGGVPVQLTQGLFEVLRVRLSEDKQKFYLMTSEAGPDKRGLYSLPISGGTRTFITRLSQADEDDWEISPDEKTLAIVRSTGNRPPELFLLPNKPSEAREKAKGERKKSDSVKAKSHSDNSAAPALAVTSEEEEPGVVQVTHSPTPEWQSYHWIDPPIVTYKARDGATVYARLYKPAKWKKGGPAVLFVHGAGYLQNAHSWWSYYYREYMFHHLLTERGYMVLDADYRGSAGYGRDWRTGIYRHMGGKDLDDEVDGAKWLVSTYGVDAKRIGLYGGSYGGFLTLMAMFTQPDVFAAGAALRPVTDWAHYNAGYTANILNEPQNDPAAYRQSSPIFFAEGLKGALLICHGMMDDNVLFQDSVRLEQRLIELHKENWELAAYPVESHAFEEPSSWADEYKRILKLFETNLHH